ncbi:MAG: rRNA maturation RNase YbeY [Paludibacteraceae bacterium]|nr:rRNA maturation RNase YbeY [Paludibacteraceae bacterium]
MITYSTRGTDMPELDRPRIERWMTRVGAVYGKRIGRINYVFCNDAEELAVNQQFLQHDYLTDVITFDYSTRGLLSGDVFISLDMIRSNADEFGADFATELRRILIHGLLHLTGQGDKTPETRRQMTEKEDAALAMY